MRQAVHQVGPASSSLFLAEVQVNPFPTQSEERGHLNSMNRIRTQAAEHKYEDHSLLAGWFSCNVQQPA
jgi:hypothetical protein